MQVKEYETNEKIDNHFSRMIACHQIVKTSNEWIIDSGASPHMSSSLHKLSEVLGAYNSPKISLPIGVTAEFTQQGT